MAFHEAYRRTFLQQAGQAAPARLLAPVADYEVRLEPAPVPAGGAFWRLVGIHHLTPDENRGGHQIFVDVVDEAAIRIPASEAQVQWGWEGQRPEEVAPAKALDKPAGEPATNLDVYGGQRVWVEIDGGGLPSDRVSNLHTGHADEPGPGGELWNSWGHHSFYLVFQRSRGTAAAEVPAATTAATTPTTTAAASHTTYIPTISTAGGPTPALATEPEPTPQPEPQPKPTPASPTPAPGNRLGFYLHLSTDQDGLWEAIRQVQPPVILVHADTLNRLLLREIRAFRAPEAFVVGRLYKDNHTQRTVLTHGDPARHGREMADEILDLDFGLATERRANGRLLIDAWMSLNEPVPGPASQQFAEQPVETAAMLHAYDRFQVAFHRRLQEAGVGAVAFNFGAGNFSRPEHYLDHFPGTLAAYTYLGFHEYGWPTLYPEAGSASAAGLYRVCMEGIRRHYGPHHRALVTEAGLTRMYRDSNAGDVGWLNREQPLTQEEYWRSLQWYNQHLLADDYVLGACLYEVGHHGDWETFRHLGRDKDGQPLRLMERIADLNAGSARSAPRSRGLTPSTPTPSTPTAPRGRGVRGDAGFVRVHGTEFLVNNRPLRFVGVNIRGLAHYGDGRTLPFTQPEHRREQIRAARAMGARVIRIFLPSIHADTATTVERLRSLIALLKEEAPDMYLLPALCNLYHDVEFRIPGDDVFYERLDPNFPGHLLNAAFFQGGYRANYLPFVQQVVPAFREEPAIFAWEIGNELKLNPLTGNLESDPHIAAFLDFMHTAAREIRRLAPNHLVTTGMISTHHAWLHTPGLRRQLYAGPSFDFLTVHCYNDERENDDSELAKQLGKPFIVEEAGYGLSYGHDRSPKVREDMAYWFGRGSRGYMPWGFMATNQDIGDGDRDSGLDRTLHGDWEPLFRLFQQRAGELAQSMVNWQPPAPPTNVTEPFRPGQTVFSTDWVNVRKSPGHLGKLGDDVLGMLAPDSPATIQEGPTSRDGLTWWTVQAVLADGQQVTGWVAEASATTHLLTTAQPQPGHSREIPESGQSRSRGTAREQPVTVRYRYAAAYVNLRRTPGYVGKPSEDVIGQVPYGAKVEVVEGPNQADALVWWSVRAPLLDNSVGTGWAAETAPDGINLLADVPPPPPAPSPGQVHGQLFRPDEALRLLSVGRLLPDVTPAAHDAQAVGTPLLPNTEVRVVLGPEVRDGVEWWQVTQTGPSGTGKVGWAPLTTDEGTRLLAATAVAEALRVARPFAGTWSVTQGWGLQPDFYQQFLYDGVPLKGHNGLDFGTPEGTPLLAVDDAEVLRVDFEPDGFGHFVLLRHRWGESLYAHLNRVDVPQGAALVQGQVLGLSGNSGGSTGPHLHFGLRVFPYRRTDGWGGFVNPLPLMPLEDLPISRGPGLPPAAMAPELPGRRRP